MVTAAWDISNLVALYKDGKQCETCCIEFVSGSPPADCCCFLDPTTFAWDTVRTFAQGELSEDGGNTFESVQNGNRDHVTSDTDWWTHVSANVSCGNADWDAFPPYGGPAKTPAFYTVTAKITFPSGASYSWYSDSVPHSDTWGYPFGAGPCGWRTNPIGTPDHTHFMLAPDSLHGNCEPSNPEEWYVSWTLGSGDQACTEFFGEEVGDMAASLAAIPCLGIGALADCPISGTVSGSHDDAEGNCIRRLTDKSIWPWVYEEGSGIFSWHPGPVPEWDKCTDYEVGDMVAHEGVFYKCKLAHNAGAPPTCTGAKEPPNATYWDVV